MAWGINNKTIFLIIVHVPLFDVWEKGNVSLIHKASTYLFILGLNTYNTELSYTYKPKLIAKLKHKLKTFH